MKRKSISKATREKVYAKYGGRCAYCGCKLEYKDMQVDHLDAVYRAEAEGREASDSIDNLYPSCRMCNFYKGTSKIEEFRKKLLTFQAIYFPEHFHTRLAHKYGMMTFAEWDGRFYFERMSLTEEVKKVIDEVEYNKRVSNLDLMRLHSFGIPALAEWKESHYVWEDFCDLLKEKYSL